MSSLFSRMIENAIQQNEHTQAILSAALGEQAQAGIDILQENLDAIRVFGDTLRPFADMAELAEVNV